MIFIEEHGLGLGYLLLLLVEGDIVMVYSFGEEVIVFIEVDFEWGKGWAFIEKHVILNLLFAFKLIKMV